MNYIEYIIYKTKALFWNLVSIKHIIVTIGAK